MQLMIHSLARLTALVGGLVLLFLVLMTTVSVLGREVGVGEITGGYEVLEAGVAFAIFAFLPLCQLYGAHATVDVFTGFLPRGINRWIAAFWEVILSLVILLIVWRLYGGFERYYGNGETTIFLQFPVWWAYGASVIAGLVACVVAVYCAVMRIGEAALGRAILPSEQAEH
ncbi:MAG: TRAP transporter small permease [Sulfitobacter sp.]